MSARELTRVEVLSRVKAGTLSVGSAATLLAVSYRQAKRLARRYRAEGAKGLKHRSAGGASNHARPRPSASGCWRSCGRSTAGRSTCGSGRRWPPSIWRAKTASRCTTTRCAGGCWRRACGVGRASGVAASPAAGAQGAFRRAGAARWQFPSLVRGRAPRAAVLMNLVDDATGRTLARLGAQETIWAAVDVLRRWIEAYGVPLALYTDWKNVYVRGRMRRSRPRGPCP